MNTHQGKWGMSGDIITFLANIIKDKQSLLGTQGEWGMSSESPL